MGRRLTELQNGILWAIDAADEGKGLVAGDIIDALDLPRTPSSRAALSRSLRRLVRRGYLDALTPHVARIGRGYIYTRHDPKRPPAPPDPVQIILKRKKAWQGP